VSLIRYYFKIILTNFIRRIPICDIPRDNEGSNNWIHKLYREKDQIYDYFVQHGTFEGNGLPRIELSYNYYDLLIEFGWIILIGIPSIIYLFQFLWTSSFIAKLAGVPDGDSI
jgi:hypothetical protein